MKKKILCTLALISALSTSAFAASATVAIDGKAVENSSVIRENGLTYISVRPLAEALDLDVEWLAETKSVVISNGGPLYITFTIGENGYTFAKTAPMKLSGAPIIADSTAYVPVDIVTDLLNFEVKEDNNVLNIITSANVETEDKTESDSAVEVNEGTGVVTEVSDEEILFNDYINGEVRLNKSTDVKVSDNEGNDFDINEIKVGAQLSVVYGDIMTKSLPPLNTPVSIEVISNEAEKGTGSVVEVSDEEILFNDDVKGEVRLNKSDNIKITDEEGNYRDINEITEGTKLTVIYGQAMTMSIPPLNNPVSITINTTNE